MPFVVSTNKRIRKWAFIDQTGRQSIEDNCVSSMDSKLRRRLYDRETVAYQLARASSHTASGLRTAWQRITEFRKTKIHIVKPGAHLDGVVYETWCRIAKPPQYLHAASRVPLLVVFCGNDDLRGKGLDRLIEGVSLAKARGFRGRLRMYGRFRRRLRADTQTEMASNLPGLSIKRGTSPFHRAARRQ